jgi:hypothetical protein
MDQTGNNRGLRYVVLLIILMSTAALATACGSNSSSPGSTAGQQTKYQQMVDFSQCMRSHGVPNFPDPGSGGALAIDGNTLHVSHSVMQAAQSACRHLLPNGGQPTAAERQQAISQALRFAQCMRTHGVPSFPDPKMSGGGIFIGGRGIDPQSPQFQTAQKACEALMPGGRKSGSGVQVAGL